MTEPLDVARPGLLGTRTATLPQRFARRAILLVLAAAAAAAFARFGVLAGQLAALPASARTVAQGAAGLLAFLVFDVLWTRVAGRVPSDVLVGLRMVGDDGRQHGGSCAGDEFVTMALALLTAGVGPALLALATRDALGRTALDRGFALVLIDVRRGRDVQLDPVRQTELDRLMRVQAPPAPAVVTVDGLAARPAPLGVPDAGRPPAALPRAVQRIRLDDGTEYQLRGPALIGRAPSGAAVGADILVIAITDPAGRLSKTHARLSGDASGVWVEDVGSTNGTRLFAPDTTAAQARPGVPVLARPGTRVEVGGRTFEVLSAVIA